MKRKEMDRDLEKYIPLIDFFSQLLGPQTEIVLHDIRSGDFEASIVYIKNGLTGRTLGSPATDLLLNIIEKGSYKTQNYLLNYRSKSFDGREFQSSSYFIKDDEGNLIGMICVNTDETFMKQMGYKMEEALAMFRRMTSFEAVDPTDNTLVTETLFNTTNGMIDEAVYFATGVTKEEASGLSRHQKLKVVATLNDRQFFAYKNAIAELADVFQMSEVSIYKYLQTIKNIEE